MGWPVSGSEFPSSIDQLRWRFASEVGVRHKWHKKAGDIDNDFVFVLGRLDRRYAEPMRVQGTMEDVKLFLAGLEEGVLVTIAPETLQVIGYLDAQLPPCSALVESFV